MTTESTSQEVKTSAFLVPEADGHRERVRNLGEQRRANSIHPTVTLLRNLSPLRRIRVVVESQRRQKPLKVDCEPRVSLPPLVARVFFSMGDRDKKADAIPRIHERFRKLNIESWG